MKILITGVTSGIGKELAINYLKAGHVVVGIGRNSIILDELAKIGLNKVQVDLSDIKATRNAFNEITQKFSYIDLAILNAGNCEYIDVINFDATIVQRVINANVISLASSIEGVLPLLRKAQKPQLVGVASLAGYLPLIRAEAYGASKAAVDYMLEALAIDLAQENILVTVVNPGFVKTPLTDKNDFPMPSIVDVSFAANAIMTGIKKRKTEIHFPYKLSIPIKLLSLLPRKWWRYLGRMLKNKEFFMRIAIIGSGISGLYSAYLLNKNHDVELFEANDYIGGHTHTVDVSGIKIDTGFIVFNDRNYPNFKKLLDDLEVEYRPTQMSFSVRNDKLNLEYGSSNLNSLFANRLNLFNYKFYGLLKEILYFNKLAKANNFDSNLTLGDFLHQNKFSERFIYGYILPMGSAIWSMGISDMLAFPLSFFITFLNNHGLLEVNNHPQWYTICGGSANYVTKLISGFKNKIHLQSKVISVSRIANKIELHLENNSCHKFDQVIFACHADESLEILKDASAKEREVLGDLRYSKSNVILHKDTELLPRKKRAYSSWNYLMTNDSMDNSTLTYNMNILQGITSNDTYCVTLNSKKLINPDKICAEFNYSHPVYDIKSIIAQKNWDSISGKNNTHFCGAYWNNGFHEDGVTSALRVYNSIENKYD